MKVDGHFAAEFLPARFLTIGIITHGHLPADIYSRILSMDISGYFLRWYKIPWVKTLRAIVHQPK